MTAPRGGRRTVAVVLAAGAGSRFHGDHHKLLAPLRGKPLVRWALDAALDAGLDRTIVVTGAVDLTAVLPSFVETVANPDWAGGIATSLAVAVAAMGEDDGALVVGLGDQPGVPAPAWRAVAAAPGAIAVATYDGRRRNPVRLDRSVWPLLPVTGDEGARTLMRDHPELVVEVPCAGSPFDVDTTEDLARWGSPRPE